MLPPPHPMQDSTSRVGIWEEKAPGLLTPPFSAQHFRLAVVLSVTWPIFLWTLRLG